jgi:hypothetical protein
VLREAAREGGTALVTAGLGGAFGRMDDINDIRNAKRTGDQLRAAQKAKRQFCTNPDFKDWMHRNFRKTPGTKQSNPDFTDDDLIAGWEEWNDIGRPKRRN